MITTDLEDALSKRVSDLEKQLAKANERVRELESFNKELRCAIHQGSASVVQALLKKDKEGEVALNKFAIEKKIEGVEWFSEQYCDDEHWFIADKAIEQLRKEQE